MGSGEVQMSHVSPRPHGRIGRTDADADRGATSLEYAVIIAFVVVGFAGAMLAFAGTVSGVIGAIAGAVTGWVDGLA